MKILLIEDNVFDYLLNHVVQKHVQQGISCEELSVASALWKMLNQAKTIDFSKLGKLELEKLGAKGITLGIPEQQQEVTSCPVNTEAPGC